MNGSQAPNQAGKTHIFQARTHGGGGLGPEQGGARLSRILSPWIESSARAMLPGTKDFFSRVEGQDLTGNTGLLP
jgi:hypothetical protein